jgi:hypothetical protein
MSSNLVLAPLLERLTIQTKELTTERFPIYSEFGWAQRDFLHEIERQYNSGLPVRIVVLKARQLGISTAMEGVLFWWSFIHPGTQGLVIAHENDASQYLFEKTKLYWDTWPYHDIYTAKHSTQRRLSWEENRSSIRVATAKNVQSGRGRTLHAVHASECAFYAEPEALMIGLRQTIPNKHGTIMVLESTANGIGNWFHEEWNAAEQGESDYIPLFYPWFQHFEYSMPTSLSTEIELLPEEREIIRLGASYENLEWRRWAIRNLCGADIELFHQEYPSTAEEAFITSGTNVFPYTALELVYAAERGYRGTLVADDLHGTGVRFVPDHQGPLTIYRSPNNRDRRWDRYFIAADPSMTISGDPACIQVINRGSMEQVAVWHGRIDPINFANEMMLLGRYYHDAELCPEVEGGGQATVAAILTSGYPNVWQHRWADKAPGKVSISYGWATNWQRKQWCIGKLKSLIADQSITLHDQKTYRQLRNYCVLGNGDMGNADPKVHDDAVMALAICVTASMTEGPYAEERTAQSDVFDIFNQQELV